MHLSLDSIFFPLHALLSLLKTNLPHALILDLTLLCFTCFTFTLKVVLLYDVLLDLFFANIYMLFSQLDQKTLASTLLSCFEDILLYDVLSNFTFVDL